MESSEYSRKTLLNGSRPLRLWTRPYGTVPYIRPKLSLPALTLKSFDNFSNNCLRTLAHTVRSRPEAQRTRSLQKCFPRIFTGFHWIRLFNDIIYYINSPFVLSVPVESSRCSFKITSDGIASVAPRTRPYYGIIISSIIIIIIHWI